MIDEPRRPGRPRKEAIEASIESTQPSAVRLAATILPAIISHLGPSGVKTNCALAMQYAKELLTFEDGVN